MKPFAKYVYHIQNYRYRVDTYINDGTSIVRVYVYYYYVMSVVVFRNGMSLSLSGIPSAYITVYNPGMLDC